MQRADFTDAFFDAMQSSILDVNQSETLPPACYADPAFFEFEKEAIFFREWLCVGREAWIREPGDYFTASHVGEPLIIVRNQSGRIKALSAVCQHRAALVAEGHGKKRAFLCPYHHWSYSLDGQLIGAPAMERACDFNKREIRLPEIRLESWLGFIFVNFDPGAPPLAPRLTAVADILKNYDVFDRGGVIPLGSTANRALELESPRREFQRRLSRQSAPCRPRA